MPHLPNSKKDWRSQYAVLKTWNKGTHYVELNTNKTINCWVGLAASQQVPFEMCILYGGWLQIWIEPKLMGKLKNDISIPPNPTGWK
jgi:hypothetical protein